MPYTENPDLGFYDFENNPIITDTELPIAFRVLRNGCPYWWGAV
jgi:hypothetical protein